ncbi:MAG: YggT family protein [Chloroflexota bacterium]
MTIFFQVVRLFCQFLSLAIFLRAIISWFSPYPNTLTILLDRITEPFLRPLRRIIPLAGNTDFTPLVAIIVLQLIVYLLP